MESHMRQEINVFIYSHVLSTSLMKVQNLCSALVEWAQTNTYSGQEKGPQRVSITVISNGD